MSGRLAAAGCLVAAAAVVAAPVRPATRRLRALLPSRPVAGSALPGTASADAGHDAVEPARTPVGWQHVRYRRAGAAVLGGLSIALLVGGWPGLAVGAVSAVVLDRVVGRLEPRAVRTGRRRATEDLPLAADLLAAVVRAGAPIDRATGAVGEALGGPLGERLRRVSRALRLGATADVAWSHLSDVDGAERLVTAAVRSSASGAALASALTRLADDLRSVRLTDQDAATRRAGVLLVLPLGLCFLPAFVLAGLVPVVIAVLDDVL